MAPLTRTEKLDIILELSEKKHGKNLGNFKQLQMVIAGESPQEIKKYLTKGKIPEGIAIIVAAACFWNSDKIDEWIEAFAEEIRKLGSDEAFANCDWRYYVGIVKGLFEAFNLFHDKMWDGDELLKKVENDIFALMRKVIPASHFENHPCDSELRQSRIIPEIKEIESSIKLFAKNADSHAVTSFLKEVEELMNKEPRGISTIGKVVVNGLFYGLISAMPMKKRISLL